MTDSGMACNSRSFWSSKFRLLLLLLLICLASPPCCCCRWRPLYHRVCHWRHHTLSSVAPREEYTSRKTAIRPGTNTRMDFEHRVVVPRNMLDRLCNRDVDSISHGFENVAWYAPHPMLASSVPTQSLLDDHSWLLWWGRIPQRHGSNAASERLPTRGPESL